jgi:hypothetical protein
MCVEPQKKNQKSKIKNQNWIVTKILSYFIIFVFFLTSTFYLLPFSVNATAGINRQINFQGKIVNKTTTTNIPNDSYVFTFKFYNAATDGDQLPISATWTENQTLPVTNGIFRATLGSVTPIPTALNFNDDAIYLDITFAGEIFTTRVRMTSVPYAINAQKVSGLTVTDTTGTLTIPSGKTISFADAFTTSGAYPLTLTVTNTTNATLPAGTITLVDLASDQTLTTKTIGSTGLIFSGAATDIATVSNQDLAIIPNGTGKVGIGTTSPTQMLDVLGFATVSGNITMGGQLQLGRLAADPTEVGIGAMYYNTVNNKFRCYVNNAWADCGGTGGSSVWSDLTAPSQALSLNMYQSVGTSFATTFTYGNTTSSTNLFNITDTASNNGTGYLMNLTTASSSTLKPFHVSAAGTEAITVLANGNVGIGTTSPSEKLDVGGKTVIGKTSLADGGTTGKSSYDLILRASGWTGSIETSRDWVIRNSSSQYLYENLSFVNPGGTTIAYFDGGTGGKFILPVYGANLNGVYAGWNSAGTIGGSNYGEIITLNSNAIVQGLNAATIPLIVRGKLSQTANLQEWQNSTNTPLSVIDANGNLGIGTTTPTALLQLASSTVGSTLFDVVFSGSSMFSVTDTQIVNNLPASFNAPGDVAIAYDLNFTNATASYLKSAAPLYIVSGETFNSSDLNLATYNKGNVIITTEALSVVGAATTSGKLTASTGSTSDVGLNLNTAQAGPTCASLSNGDFGFDSSNNRIYWKGTGGTCSYWNRTGTFDIAEHTPSSEAVEPGDVLVIDTSASSFTVKKSDKTYQQTAVGVESTEPTLISNPDALGEAKYISKLALAGRVPVKVSLENGEITAGDYLTTSSTPGVAMKATKNGQIIGKALENYNGRSQVSPMVTKQEEINASIIRDKQTYKSNPSLWQNNVGKIMMFINFTWYNPINNMAVIDSSNSATLQSSLFDSNIIASSSGLTLMGNTNIYNLNIMGNITNGLLTIGAGYASGSASIQTVMAPLELQKDSLGNLEIMGSKIVIDTFGNMVTKETITAREIKTNKLTIIDDKTATIGGVLSASAGKIEIPTGKTSVEIKTTLLTNDSMIFATPINIPTPVAAHKTGENTFEISIVSSLSENLQVNWWIIN